MVAILFLCWSHQWKLSGFAVTAIQSNFPVNIVCNGFGFYIILFGGSSSNPLNVFMRINCIEKSRFWFSLFQCNQTFFVCEEPKRKIYFSLCTVFSKSLFLSRRTLSAKHTISVGLLLMWQMYIPRSSCAVAAPSFTYFFPAFRRKCLQVFVCF